MLARLFAAPDIRRHLLGDEGEDVVDVVRKHPVCFVKPALWAVLGMALLLSSVYIKVSLAWFPLGLGLLALLVAVYQGAAASKDCFVITNMRVFRLSGVFNRRLATMPLARILDITVDKPILGRIFGYGHFVFESAAQEQGLRRIEYVGNPDERDLKIERVIARAGLRGPAIGG